MANNKTLAIDCMGGDFGPSVIVPAAIQALQAHSELHLYLVGQEAQITPYLTKVPGLSDRIQLLHAEEVIAMDEKPSRAIRSKPNSSMRKALELVKAGKAQAFVSAGNTGALMALATLLIGTLPGVERPAIVVELPNRKGGETHMLDLGANIEASAEQLATYAAMGSVLAQAISSEAGKAKRQPKVALLNIGEEAIKGRDSIKLAAELLQQQKDLNYQGYIEANQIFNGDIDVIVCDGFTGNNVLKASEGITRFLYDQLKAEFTSSWRNKLAALMVKPVLNAFKKRINPDHYNGASLLGLREIVIKSHGSADQKATLAAIEKAILEVERQVPQKIQHQVAELLQEQVTE
ncbi:phosphate acyltransferase PlsX [Kangiella sp. TOML190]|uniref:phosphate acyltransferase PlsX n=1 Tax=Kangiella sp. TOML190 TaxID=2931351 RepID=UPI00203DC146|nr:phosphate acyltransferase PlsX [Kangiella sp. TOML190]